MNCRIQQEREMRLMKRKQVSDRVEDINAKFTKEPEIKTQEEPRKTRFDMSIVPTSKCPVPTTPIPSPFDRN